MKVPGTGAVPVRYDDNDIYLCARQSQGFASTFGAGLLYDQTGNDIYRAGGHYLHPPLLPNDFQSLSQGFSIGFRPRAAGGVGILIDEEGNDFYDAEVYAQGTSYWYSIGLLFDGAGNDRYLATQYAQGAGVHLSVGSLWDRGGDDHYVAQLGVTQGTAHDLSVGLLIDESGNDYYVVERRPGDEHHQLDRHLHRRAGRRHLRRPGRRPGLRHLGARLLRRRDLPRPGGQGHLPAQPARPRRRGLVGRSQRDRHRPRPRPASCRARSSRRSLTAADSARTVEELFETASIWEVGSAREKVARGPQGADDQGRRGGRLRDRRRSSPATTASSTACSIDLARGVSRLVRGASHAAPDRPEGGQCGAT